MTNIKRHEKPPRNRNSRPRHAPEPTKQKGTRSKRDFISCSRTQPLVCRDDMIVDEPNPAPRRQPATARILCRYSNAPKPRRTGHQTYVLPPSTLAARPVCPYRSRHRALPIFRNTRPSKQARLAVLSPPPPRFPLHSRPYFRSMASSDCSATGSTTPGPGRIVI